MRPTAGICCAVILFGASPALAQVGQPKEPFGWPGLYVGMSLDQARSVIEKEGYPQEPAATGAREFVYDFIDPISKALTHLTIGGTEDGSTVYAVLSAQYISPVDANSNFERLSIDASKTFGKTFNSQDGDVRIRDYCVSSRVYYRVVSNGVIVGAAINSVLRGIPQCTGAQAARLTSLFFEALPPRPMTQAELAAQAETSPSDAPINVQNAPLSPKPSEIPVLSAEAQKIVREGMKITHDKAVLEIQRQYSMTEPPYLDGPYANGDVPEPVGGPGFLRYYKYYKSWTREDLMKINASPLRIMTAMAVNDDTYHLMQLLPDSYKGDVQQFSTDIRNAFKARGLPFDIRSQN